MINLQEVRLDENQLRWKEKALKSIKKYQQGALYLATGIGKSYVAKDIINDYLSEDNHAQILWIAPASALNNIKQNFFSTYENIRFESFENIRTSEKYIDTVEFNNLKLIVIDEAHKALATKTWVSVKYILDKFTDRRTREEYKRAKKGKADLLVLTASGVRSCDSRKVFEELTHRLEEHVDYEVVDLHEAIEQNLLGKIHFLNNNIGKYELMADMLSEQLSSIDLDSDLDDTFSKKREEIAELLDYISAYRNNMSTYLGNDIHEKIKDIYNGYDGDQWVVFYSRIKDAMSSTEFLTELFKEIYKHNKNIKINIYQYHNGLSESELTLINSYMYTKPDRNTVNVYVTVNKGITSIHPENVVGEIQFRSTHSQNLYEQSIGRVTKSKKHSNREVFVIDVVDNASRVVKEGYNSSNILKHIEDIERTEQNLVDKLREDFLNNIDFQTVNKKFDKIIKDFRILKDLSNITETVNKIANIIDTEAGENYKYKLDRSPYSIISSNQTLGREEISRLISSLKFIQEKFIQGEFGKGRENRLDKASPLYRMLIEKLGYAMFINSSTVSNLAVYKTLINMSHKIKEDKIDDDYQKQLYNLRVAYIKGELHESIIEFCYFLGIKLKGQGEELLRLAMDIGKIKNINVLKLFNDLSKRLSKAENGSEIDLDRAYAMYYYMNLKYSSSILMRAINITYRCVDKFNEYYMGESIKRWVEAFEQIYKIDRLSDIDNEQSVKEKRHINIGQADLELCKLGSSIETSRAFTDFEAELLKFYDINLRAINKNLITDKVMDITAISNIIYRLENVELQDSTKKAYIISLKEHRSTKMPMKWQNKIRDIIDKYDEEVKELEDNTPELIEACREKIELLEFTQDLKQSDLEQIKKTYKKAQKSKVDDAALLATCFPTIYVDHLVPAFKRMRTNEMTFDDYLAVNGTLEMGNEYIEKVAFLLKFELIDNSYLDVSKKLITKQLEFN